jgi:NAD-dependent SIR2 family protein deacetylase
MSTSDLNFRINLAQQYLQQADALLIGAGAGLSAAAGFDFSDETAFARDYPGMLTYGFRCKLDMMANFAVPQELLWGYYLQHVQETRFSSGKNQTYGDLFAIASRCSNYFVITTNTDGLFSRNDFSADRLYTPQGDYRLVQCLRPCSLQTWPVEPLIERYLPLVDKATQQLPPGNYPRCPHCGGPVFLNVRGGRWFVEEPWLAGAKGFQQWLAEHRHKKMVVLDIGSGFNTPIWIRWPAEEIVRANPQAYLLRLNLHHPEVPDDISRQAVTFAESANEVLARLVGQA